MANTQNAYAALLAAGENAGTGTKTKKRNKGTNKQANSGGEGQKVVASSASSAVGQASVNGGGAATSGPQATGLGEAVATLESTARSARLIGDKSKLWKEWSRQVRGEGAAGRGEGAAVITRVC